MCKYVWPHKYTPMNTPQMCQPSMSYFEPNGLQRTMSFCCHSASPVDLGKLSWNPECRQQSIVNTCPQRCPPTLPTMFAMEIPFGFLQAECVSCFVASFATWTLCRVGLPGGRHGGNGVATQIQAYQHASWLSNVDDNMYIIAATCTVHVGVNDELAWK